MELKEAVQLWKDNDIENCNMEFSCGGDSMNDYSFIFYDTKANIIENQQLNDFFDSEVFRCVDFYEASDGHYIGEAGNVDIRLNSEEDGFTYEKQSEFEYNETYSTEVQVELTEKEKLFVEEYISEMFGGDMEEDAMVFSKDCILTDENEECINSILKKINFEMNNCKFTDIPSGADQDSNSLRWEITNDGKNLSVVDDKLIILVSAFFTYYTDSEN